MSDTEAEDSDKRREEPNQKLLEASDSGDHEVVSRLLNEGAEVSSKNSDGNLGIHLSAVKGHEKVVAEFLRKGQDVNIRSGQFNSSPLMWAAQEGHTNVIRLLLDHGAQIDLHNEGGETALTIAAYNSHSEAVSELLLRGADETLADNGGLTALQWAEKKGNNDAPQSTTAASYTGLSAAFSSSKLPCQHYSKDSKSDLK